MKTVIQIILGIAICVMSYLIYESVQKPIRFNEEQLRRYETTIQRLKDIRTAQVAYRSEYKKYTGSFDTLIAFLKHDSFRVVRQVGDLDDSADIKAGRISRDTIRVSVLDSLFKKGYMVDSLPYVPYTNNYKFEMGTGHISAGNVKVNVFEAKVSNNVLLKGLDPQLLVNFNVERETKTKYAGLRVGSLTETNNNAGNWE